MFVSVCPTPTTHLGHIGAQYMAAKLNLIVAKTTSWKCGQNSINPTQLFFLFLLLLLFF